MYTKATRQHKWLRQMVGEWKYEGEADMCPGEARHRFQGSEKVRSIGELWIVAEGKGKMPEGTRMTSQMTLGYNPATKRFVGSWIGSPMAHQWVYEGRQRGNVLTLETTGPGFSGKRKEARYRDVIEMKSRDHRVLRSSYQDASGKWVTFMTCHYTRTK
jgi:hypothetical protein